MSKFFPYATDWYDDAPLCCVNMGTFLDHLIYDTTHLFPTRLDDELELSPDEMGNVDG